MKKFLTLFFILITSANAVRPPQATLCAACHGEKGISTNPEWPNLAGQHASYLFKELTEIQQGKTRQVPLMAGIVANLSEKELLDLAHFYAEQAPAQGQVSTNYLKRGQEIYRGGDRAKQITACIACHGPKGQGNEQAKFPAVSGQHAVYTLLQLQAFKAGQRTNDLNHIMRDIAQRMSKEDMEAVAYYMQGLY